MDKKEVIDLIERMRGCYACVYSCNEQGYNKEYHSQLVDNILDEEIEGYDNLWCIKDDEWALDEFTPITNNDIDIYTWAQEFDDETIEAIKSQIDEGLYYLASFSNEFVGEQKILVWEE